MSLLGLKKEAHVVLLACLTDQNQVCRPVTLTYMVDTVMPPPELPLQGLLAPAAGCAVSRQFSPVTSFRVSFHCREPHPSQGEPHPMTDPCRPGRANPIQDNAGSISVPGLSVRSAEVSVGLLCGSTSHSAQSCILSFPSQ